MGFFRRSRRTSLLDSESKKLIGDIRVSGIDPIYGGITIQGLPVQLNIVINYLEYVAIRLPEVFAKEVRHEDVIALQENINRDQANAGYNIIQMRNPHLVGALLIHQLKQLHIKNPICNSIIQEHWHEGCASKDKATSVEHFQKSIALMDGVTYNIFWRLCRLFKSLHLEVEVTKMSSTRLCLIFVPILFPKTLAQHKESFDGLDKCILFQSYIFDRFRSNSMSLDYINFQESILSNTLPEGTSNPRAEQTRIMAAHLIDSAPKTSDAEQVTENIQTIHETPAATQPKSRAYSSMKDSKENIDSRELFREVLVLQYSVMCHEKRIQSNRTIVREYEEENERLSEECKALLSEKVVLEKELAEFNLDSLESQIKDEEERVEQLSMMNEELSETLRELEKEYEILESPITNPEKRRVMQEELETGRLQFSVEELKRENFESLNSIKDLANFINCIREQQGLPLLVIPELDQFDLS